MLENFVFCRLFEIYVDFVMLEVIYFCFFGLRLVFKNVIVFFYEVFEFYEEYLSCRYLYIYYK